MGGIKLHAKAYYMYSRLQRVSRDTTQRGAKDTAYPQALSLGLAQCLGLTGGWGLGGEVRPKELISNSDSKIQIRGRKRERCCPEVRR